MMEKKCVVDATRHYKAYVSVDVETQSVSGYALNSDDVLIDTDPPIFKTTVGTDGYISPGWNGESWSEGATAEEIATWEAEHPAPEAPGPSHLDSIEAQSTYTAMMTNTLLEG